MVQLDKWEEFKFLDVAILERAKKGKVYKAGTLRIQLSATKGQVYYNFEDGAIDSKFGVITPAEWVDGKYLFYILEKFLPPFLTTYQTGININPKIFKWLKLKLHTEKETQLTIVRIMDELQTMIDLLEDDLDTDEVIKKHYLNGMMC